MAASFTTNGLTWKNNLVYTRTWEIHLCDGTWAPLTASQSAITSSVLQTLSATVTDGTTIQTFSATLGAATNNVNRIAIYSVTDSLYIWAFDLGASSNLNAGTVFNLDVNTPQV